jgi:hypothetical protein
MADAATDERLRQAFGFGDDELAANLLGRLTARQEAVVASVHQARRQRLMIIWGVVGLAIVVGLLLGLLLPDSGSRPRQWAMYIPFALTALLVVVGVLYETVAGRRRTAALRARQLSRVEGQASLSSGREVRYTVHFVQIGPERFRFTSTDQWHTFAASRRYRVFYIAIPPQHTILSVELLAGDEPGDDRALGDSASIGRASP